MADLLLFKPVPLEPLTSLAVLPEVASSAEIVDQPSYAIWKSNHLAVNKDDIFVVVKASNSNNNNNNNNVLFITPVLKLHQTGSSKTNICEVFSQMQHCINAV